MLFSILRDPEHNIQTLDISGNEFNAEQFELMRISMTNNKSLISLDLRRNPGCSEGNVALYKINVVHRANLSCIILAMKSIDEIEKCVHQNEHQARTSFAL